MRPRLRAAWGRLRPWLLLALPPAFLTLALGCAVLAWTAERTNRGIAALEAGRDLAVAPGAPSPLLAARIRFLAVRGRLEEAEPLLAALDRRAEPHLAALARTFVANARMRDAFARLGRGDLDRAGPLVTMARQDYRRALRDRPDLWDAKYNLDVASRLIRDFPEIERGAGDEMRADPKQIWTDIPGQPRGGP